jgi:hypothetical protein
MLKKDTHEEKWSSPLTKNNSRDDFLFAIPYLPHFIVFQCLPLIEA